jgi:hypothetical protein
MYRHPSEFTEAKLASMTLISLKQWRYTFTVSEESQLAECTAKQLESASHASCASAKVFAVE